MFVLGFRLFYMQLLLYWSLGHAVDLQIVDLIAWVLRVSWWCRIRLHNWLFTVSLWMFGLAASIL